MGADNGPAASIDSAVFCIGLITRLNGISLSSEQIRHRIGSGQDAFSSCELARILSGLGFKTTLKTRTPTSVPKSCFPAIGRKQTGEFVVLIWPDRERNRVLVHDRNGARAHWLSEEELQDQFETKVILVRKKTGLTPQGENSFGWRWFLRTAARYRSILRDCLLASLFVQLFSLASPLVFMIVIDRVLGSNSLSTLDVLIVGLIVISLFEVLLNGLRSYLLDHTARRIDLTLGSELFNHLIFLPMSYFQTRRAGDTVARVKELDQIRRFITGSGIMLLLDLVFVVVFLAVMFLFSQFLSWLVIGVLPLLFLVSFLITPFLRDRLNQSYASKAENQAFLVEIVSGIETIKSLAAERNVCARWEERAAEQAKSDFRSGRLARLLGQLSGLTGKLLSVLLLYFGAKEVMRGHLSVGQLIAFNMLSSRVIAPILRLAQTWKEFQQLRVSVARVGDIFRTPQEPGLQTAVTSLPEIVGSVRFEQVSFRYLPESPEVLKDITFSIDAGEIVGIVGATGSGKSTLVKLLQRLLVPESGRILIDGVDIRAVDASWLRRQIGVVSQDSLLFNGSIKENLTFHAPDAGLERILEITGLVGAHEFIVGLPNGYDTAVGERGLQLSAGQRQRLLLARALIRDPGLLLLDEATNALDLESESFVQHNLRRLCNGRTVFIITHRLSPVVEPDRVLTLDRGVLVENDAPRVLRQTGGRYSQLCRLQENSYV